MSLPKIAIVIADYYKDIGDRLLDGALECLADGGINQSEIPLHRVDGAFELPLTLKWLAASGQFDGLVALGCVIRGETSHYDVVVRAAADGIARVIYDYSLPIGFGLLTVDNQMQALQRSLPDGSNKGRQAAQAMLNQLAIHNCLPPSPQSG